MATAESVGEATCPVCEEYEGAPASVEGHISAMNDASHGGLHGIEYRPELRQQATESDPSHIEAVDDAVGDGVAEPDGEAVEPRGVADDVGDGDGDEPDMPNGIPVPVPSTALIAGVAVLLVVMLLVSRSSTNSEQDDDGAENELDLEATGLVSGGS